MKVDAPAGFDDGDASEIEAIANATELEVRAELPGLSHEMTLAVKTGGFVIPETGETGAAVAPGPTPTEVILELAGIAPVN